MLQVARRASFLLRRINFRMGLSPSINSNKYNLHQGPARKGTTAEAKERPLLRKDPAGEQQRPRNYSNTRIMLTFTANQSTIRRSSRAFRREFDDEFREPRRTVHGDPSHRGRWMRRDHRSEFCLVEDGNVGHLIKCRARSSGVALDVSEVETRIKRLFMAPHAKQQGLGA
uniref:Uncharacterized protein n=1 Tax=Oryza sativa subsp. japonica TaxID=39947 RepID=Q67U65_ORYSJ|nr:hypothetical protein [Oryza sativa Japonica Group]BAD38306.1 hypothetical protein [Oryza sativa Japonica Group]